jgi:hypothetical protein
VQCVIHLPPRDPDWTSRERSLLDALLNTLEREGVTATRYEWLVGGDAWCAFRERNAQVRVELGRVGRAYYLHWADSARRARTLDLEHALELIRAQWPSDHAPHRRK